MRHPSTGKVEAKRSGQDYPQLQRKFKASLGYINCFRTVEQICGLAVKKQWKRLTKRFARWGFLQFAPPQTGFHLWLSLQGYCFSPLGFSDNFEEHREDELISYLCPEAMH